jgi:hypothetical protein
VSDAEQLIRYAASAQLAQLKRETDISLNTVASAIGMNSANLNHALQGSQRLTSDRLRQLDEVVVALAPHLEQVGGLSALAVRLRGLHDRTNLAAHTPPSWTRELLETPSNDELHVLIQASALVSNFLAAEKTHRSMSRLRERYSQQIRHVVDRLILIGVAPATARNVEALVLLGSLAKYAFDITWHQLEHFLQTSPLGFRLWRALTTLVVLSTDDTSLADKLKPRVRELLEGADRLRERSLYPGRSLDLELAIAIPREWLAGERPDWVADVLLARARKKDATLRERGTAALGLWQRSLRDAPDGRSEVRAQLLELIEDFRAAEHERPDIASGLRWIAATLQAVLDQDIPICNQWPEVSEEWFQLVREAGELLEREDMPAEIREATKKLFLHALLQNAGVERRQAVDTILAGGWTEPVSRALGHVLQDQKAEKWLRIRALFALGFLQRRDLTVERILTAACRQAHQSLTEQGANATLATVTEVHTALFAVGDCFGTAGAEDAAGRQREALAPLLEDLVSRQLSDGSRTDLYPVARAAAYLLIFTAQPRTGTDRDLSERLLRVLSEHPDSVTAEFSKWALNFRFAPDGHIRPLLAAAAVGQPDRHSWPAFGSG